jgi:thiamine biosynthesis lipoprotein
MANATRMTRRRLLLIGAAAGFAPAVNVAQTATFRWSGYALGADAYIHIAGLDQREARRICALAMAEIERLENVFSLYRTDSELARLNKTGRLDRPSHDMRVLLRRALDFWQLTDGAFNPAIQPVWRYLARHFDQHRELEPNHAHLRRLAGKCAPDCINISSSAIRLNPGAELTLNGIAQGYITDRIVEMFRAEGLTDILVSLGEHRALPGQAWQIMVPGRELPLELRNRAAATSRADATRFTADGRWHHLIDPLTGKSAAQLRQLTVLADDATTADALSTGLSVCGTGRIRAVTRQLDKVRVFGLNRVGQAFEV